MTIQTSRKGDSGTARSAGSWGERGQAWGAAAADLCGGKPKDPGTLTAEPRTWNLSTLFNYFCKVIDLSNPFSGVVKTTMQAANRFQKVLTKGGPSFGGWQVSLNHVLHLVTVE